MPNRIVVEFDASDETQASAKVVELRSEIDSLGSASAASSAQLSAAAQKYEADLIKAGVASARAREEAIKYGAAQVEAAGATVKAAGEEARAVELSAAQQKAAVESLQRQRSAALIAQFRDEERVRAESARAAARAAEQQAALALRAAESEATGAGGIGGGLRGQRAALRAGGRALGLPGEATQIGGLGLYGGGIAAIGLGIGALAAIRAEIQAISEEEQAEINLKVAAHNTGQTFLEASGNARAFSFALAVNHEEAGKLSAAFGELQLKTSGTIKDADISKFSTLISAQGLKPEDAAKALQGLARGNAEAYEELTGHRADLVLDNYARSIGTTTSKLTEWERAQALSNDALARSSELTYIADLRAKSLEGTYARLGQVASGLYSTLGDIGSGGAITELRNRQDAIALAELGQKALLGSPRQQEEDLAKARAQNARDLQERLSDQERARRALPENFQVGLSTQEREQASLSRLRAQREAAQAEYEAFQKIQSQFSSDDAKKFDDQFRDRIQSLTDQIRGLLDAEAQAVAQAQKKVVDEATQSAQGLFNFLKGYAGKDNPYVSIYTEARQAAENFQQTAKSLSQQYGAAADEAIAKLDQLTKAKQAALAEEGLAQRFSDKLDAQSYRDEAKALRAAPVTAQSAQADSTFQPESARRVLRSVHDISLGGDSSSFLSSGASRSSQAAEAEAEEKRIAEERLRALVAATDAGRIHADPRQYAAAHFKFTQDEQFRALVNAKDAGKFIGDPSLVFDPRGAGAAAGASQAIVEARNAAQLIQQMEMEAEAQGINPAVARKLADEQIISRVKGHLSDAELRSDSGLRDLVAGAYERRGDRFDSRESDAMKFVQNQANQIADLTKTIQGLIKDNRLQVNAGAAAQINISAKDFNMTKSTLGPAMTPDSTRALPGFAPGFRE
jgi:hypothetical protein